MSKFCSILTTFLLILYSSVFSDENQDSIPQIISNWRLDQNFNVVRNAKMDTSLYQIKNYNPLFINDISFNYLGNIGSPYINNYFPEKPTGNQFIFLDPFRLYLMNFETNRFYNTHKPFSLIQYSTGDDKAHQEQTFAVLHTQNINPRANAGFNFRNISSIGQYLSQKTTLNSVSLFGNFQGDKYKMHAAFNLNKFQIEENGGITSDSVFRTFAGEDNDNVPVVFPGNSSGTTRNPDALNVLRNRNFYIVNQYSFHRKSHRKVIDSLQVSDTLEIEEINTQDKMNAGVSYIIHYQDNYKRYTHRNPMSVSYYENAFIDQNNTYDSVFYRSFNNEIKLYLSDFQMFERKGNISLGIKSEFAGYAYTMIPDTTVIVNEDIEYHNENVTITEKMANDTIIETLHQKTYHNTSFHANALFPLIANTSIYASAIYYLGGYLKNDWKIKGGIEKIFNKNSDMQISADFSRITPSYFLQHFESNHFVWNNSFNPEYRQNLALRYNNDKRRLSLTVNYFLLSNYVFFNQNRVPDQSNQLIHLFSVDLKKEFTFWKFNSNNRIIYQETNQLKTLSVPEIALYHSMYFEQLLFKNVLKFQLGYDLRYSTKYYGYEYTPALGCFYLPGTTKIGNYPFADVFINIKVKRTRFFFKYEHITALIANQTVLLERNYYTAINYPAQTSVLRFGLAWTFYD